MSITRNTAGTSSPFLQFGKTRGTSVGSNTIVQNGDTLGTITFCGADGTNRDTNGAVIRAIVDSTPGENDMPTALQFSTTADGASSSTERMRIDSSGKLGLGASTVDSDIHIEKSSDLEIKLERTGSGTSTIGVPSSGELHINNTSNADMVFSTNNTEAMRIQQDGTLSVGVTGDTDAKLYVLNSSAESVAFIQSGSDATSGIRAISTSLNQNSGNTNCQHLRATTQNVGTFNLHGNGSSTFSSDERLKKNIETTRDGYLEDLAKLRVVKYNWHCHDDSTDKELGLIAQEVQKVFPKLVVEDDVELNGIEKPLAIKNSVLPMMLLKALQEANTKITALEARITTLEGE